MPARMERLRFAALMHDIGKLVVPNQLLNKPGKLTEEEFARVRVHEGVSVQMLSHIDFLRPIALARSQRRHEVRPRRSRSPDRALHHHGRRRVRRDDLDPLVPQGPAAGGRVPGAARQVGQAVPPRVRGGADPRDREAQRGARQGPRGGVRTSRTRPKSAWAPRVSGISCRKTRRSNEPAAPDGLRRARRSRGRLASRTSRTPRARPAHWCSSPRDSCSASCSYCGSRTARRCRCRTRFCWCSPRRSPRRDTRARSWAPS